ncbi:MAG: C_GCAxxG_C_C family protein [Deltaproteobacteria bacterium]|nr:C_GCAxxG_C_C family protein [Deltaproteobacteria bacterium]
MTGQKNDRVLKAATGLEGGVAASGSTCGVVSGGCLGLALFHRRALRRGGPAANRAVAERVHAYARFFEDAYGTTRCRQRIGGCDFYTLSGQVRYFLGPHRVGRCVRHIHGAMAWLWDETKKPLPETGASKEPPFHCAEAVLAKVADATGVNDPLLTRLSFVFDGGAGYSGGACGALVGAVLALNLVLGLDIRRISYIRSFGPFLRGHMNLLRERPTGPAEPFGTGKGVLSAFRAQAGSTECQGILGRRFSGWEDFADHGGRGPCRDLVDLAADLAVDALQKSAATVA